MTALLEDPELRADAERLWYSGDLSWLCREGGQKELYEFVHRAMEEGNDNLEPIVGKMHRRFGKSFVLALVLVELCIKKPGQRTIYGAPTYEQVVDIVAPNMGILLSTCPDKLRPTTQGHKWIFENPAWEPGSRPSVFAAVGVDYKRGDRLRGPWCNAAVLDEVRDMTCPRYLVEDVLSYQFANQEKPWIALASTVPRSADHEFESYFVPRALRGGRLLDINVDQNAYWQKNRDREEKRLLSMIGGGKDSISWRREALNETVGDESELILPEFQRHEASIVVDSYERPACFYSHTCLDTGWNDWNAALHGFVDFQEQTLVIEDETVARYASTGTIASQIKAREEALWYLPGAQKWIGGYKPSRMGDLTEQALEDLRTDHKVSVVAVEKYDREAAIANLRTSLQAGKVKIHSRCKNLIYQCKNGIWNEARTQFERSERLGHCDALAALVYLHRMARWNSNPFPDLPLDSNPDQVLNLKLAKKQKRIEALREAIFR